MRIKACFILFLFFGAFGVFADSESAYVSTVNGVSNAVPKGYVPPLVSNGSLCMLVDYQGGQTQRSYVNMTPTVFGPGAAMDRPRISSFLSAVLRRTCLLAESDWQRLRNGRRRWTRSWRW